jgi:hypothetical protein
MLTTIITTDDDWETADPSSRQRALHINKRATVIQ